MKINRLKISLPLILLAAATLTSCHKPAPTVDPADPKIIEKGGQSYLLITPEDSLKKEFILAKEKELPGILETTGQVTFDDRRVATITSRVQGRIEDVRVSVWDTVDKGDPILSLYSPDFMLAEEEYLQAKKNLRLDGGMEDVAQMMYDAAKSKLILLGMQESDLVSISSPSTTIWMRASQSGTILQNQAVRGANVNVGDTLYQLGTLDKVWITADIYEVDLARIQVGQVLEAVTATYPREVFKGSISRISPTLDPNKQTVQIKCEVDNPGLKLKPQMLARVKIVTKPGAALVIPQQALVYDGDGYYAFIETEPNLMQRRKVQIATWSEEGYTRILSGIREGEKVLTHSLQLNALWHQARGESY